MKLMYFVFIYLQIQSVGHISGGHLNPCVSAGMLVAGKISVVRFVLYVLTQCAGAVAGTAALRALLPEEFKQGATLLQGNILPMQGLGIEYFLGFVLVFCVFGVCDDNKPDHRFIAPLTIGLTVALGHLAAVQFTGASMNPARSFGAALMLGAWQDHWVRIN